MNEKNEIALTENEYSDLLNSAINQIHSARNALALQINTTSNTTYWNLGMLLHDRQIEGGYGSSTIKRLSVDLKEHFPDMGLSPRNLWYMKQFYERYCESDKKVQRCVALLSWRKNVLLLEKNLSDDEVFYYATESVHKNWNKDLLLNAVKMNMYLSLLDKLEKENDENQSIGIILCAEKDHLDVEIALQDIHKPIAVSDYELIVPKKELQTLVLEEMKKNGN